MQTDEVQNKSFEEKDNSTSHSSSLQECKDYIPSVFRGINTSGSYHVYGDFHVSAAKLEGSQKLSCSQVPSNKIARKESTTIISHSVQSHPNFPSTIVQVASAHKSLQGPVAPMEEDRIQHPLTSCVRMSPSFNKGVICSPQSPLRSDCQPNSPTESSSSRNANMSLKQALDCHKDAKARNWKKYKFIVMNQTPDESEKEAHGGGAQVGALSPTLSSLSSSGVGGHSEVHPEEGASEHREEITVPHSVDSCSNVR